MCCAVRTCLRGSNRCVCVVRRSPHKVHTVSDKVAKQCDLSDSRPVCRCLEQSERLGQLGTLRIADGHLAIVPLRIRTLSGKLMRPRDPLPVNGIRVRDVACKGIKAFAQRVNGAMPHLSTALLRELFYESGSDVRYVQRLASNLSDIIYVRIVDKGVGEIWGFCTAWVWDTVRQFLQTEGYDENSPTPNGVTSLLMQIASNKKWQSNEKA